jgi:hypothetical protein
MSRKTQKDRGIRLKPRKTIYAVYDGEGEFRCACKSEHTARFVIEASGFPGTCRIEEYTRVGMTARVKGV